MTQFLRFSSHNIAWKLQAVLGGWAHERLLDTYESERKPIAEQNTEESLFNYHKILEVPEVFGLDRNGLEKLAKIKNTAPAKWLPASWVEKLIALGTARIKRQMAKFYSDPKLKAKLQASIADQVAHFDRIGLDIGYHYQKGAIIPDGTDLIVPQDLVTEYIPSTRPGARFPHVDFQREASPTSSHELFDYQHFVLLIREQGQHWLEEFESLPPVIKAQTVLVQMHQSGLDETVYMSLLDLCEIDETGAILVRPDWHVAWRCLSAKHQDHLNLQEVFQRLFQNIETQSS